MESQDKADEHATDADDVAFEKILSVLPVVTYRAGETVLTGGMQTARLFILKKGAVAILKDAVEIARVDQPGAVFGEISALLDKRHIADVRALEESQFHLADAALLKKEPTALLRVARILATRVVAADTGLVELKKLLEAGQSPSVVRRMLKKIEEVLTANSGIRLPGD